ncbi:MAG: ABC transporter substrate-binding protein [Firmicutes bacterium]|nr:ABC transporter substrate-binding protein [Bacillota bacterium]
MKKWLVVLLALTMVMSMALTGCGGGDAEGGAEGDTIKIGVNYELSGAVATYGQSSVDGVTLAIEEINAAGGILGKQVEMVTIDNKSDAAEVVSVATRLMTEEGVCAVIGPATSGNFKAELPIALENGIPVISGSATANDVTSGNTKEYAFRICFSDNFQGVAMANYASKNLGAAKVAIVQDKSSDYAEGLATSFSATFEELGGEIVAREAYTTGDTDFNAILTSLAGKEFDAIWLPGYYQEVGLIIKQARALGIECPILGADGFDSPVLAELAGADALHDVYYSNHYSSLNEDETVTAFIEAYKAKHGVEPDAFNALGYDAAKLICDAIERAGAADPEAIKDALAATSEFKAVTGTLSIDENHDAQKALVVIKIDNGVAVSAENAAL